MTATNYYPAVTISDGRVYVTFADGRNGSTAISKWPRLRNASQEDLNDYYLSDVGIHWPTLDEDLSFEGILKGL